MVTLICHTAGRRRRGRKRRGHKKVRKCKYGHRKGSKRCRKHPKKR